MKPDTNLRIIGVELVGLGAFILLLLYLELNETNNNPTVVNFAWVFGIIAITLILVGLETLSVVRRAWPDHPSTVNREKSKDG
jgi:hypothetical protein